MTHSVAVRPRQQTIVVEAVLFTYATKLVEMISILVMCTHIDLPLRTVRLGAPDITVELSKCRV